MKMNQILTLCLGMLLLTLPFSTSEDKGSAKDGEQKPASQPTNNTNTNTAGATDAAGLDVLPTMLCLLIPAATLSFMH